MEFKKRDGTKIPDIGKYVKEYLHTNEGPFVIMVGCDSLPPKGDYTYIVGVVVIHRVGKGAHIVYKKKKLPRTKAIIDRLCAEVVFAVEIAQTLESAGVMKELDSFHVNVQLDLNGDKKHKSNQLMESAVGYVTSFGYECSIKPYAWAATYAADMICRGKF